MKKIKNLELDRVYNNGTETDYSVLRALEKIIELVDAVNELNKRAGHIEIDFKQLNEIVHTTRQEMKDKFIAKEGV